MPLAVQSLLVPGVNRSLSFVAGPVSQAEAFSQYIKVVIAQQLCCRPARSQTSLLIRSTQLDRHSSGRGRNS